ncbi:collagenase-like [Aphomia sociella]
MKLLVALFAVAMCQESPSPKQVNISSSSEDSRQSNEQSAQSYHGMVGIPEAERIRSEEQKPTGRIAGGLASYRGEHPFFGGLVISLTTGSTSVCGSTLVSSSKLVTAAQCWYDGYYQAYLFQVVLGSVYLFSGGTRLYTASVVTHPSYNPGYFSYDIAVITIPLVNFDNYISPAVLPSFSEVGSSYAGSRAEAIGFGKTSDADSITTSASLRDVFVDVITNSQCALIYGPVVTNNVVCTSGIGSKGLCGGDSGGPLVLRLATDKLIGVATFNSASGCRAGDPSGYTRVTAHLNWLNSQI